MSADPHALGPYRIVRRVGAGGMGIVYEAIHTGLDKRVALKVLPRELAAGRLDRFLREARTAAALHHTNIVPVFDVGQVDGVPYFAMQFIDGHPLGGRAEIGTRSAEPEGTRLFVPDATTEYAAPHGGNGDTLPHPVRGERGSPSLAVARILQAAEGVAHAHERGVVHRDIKPANLLVDSRGVVWVADFGLAFRADDPTMTADGAILGTPRYMSPEQARGEKTDARTDVYSLGVTLYELLTGTAAFTGDTLAEILQKVVAFTPPPPRALDRRISRDLETVVLKAMAKRKEDRYPTGREFADELRRYLTGEPVKARRIGPVGTAWRWSKRNPAVASLLGAVLLVFAAGAGGSVYYAKQAERREGDAKQNESKALAKEAEAAAEKRKVEDGAKTNQRLLYAARMNLASVALSDGRYARVSEYLRETYPPPGGEDLRGWEWHYLFRQVHGATRITPVAKRSGEWGWAALVPGRLLRVEYPKATLRCFCHDLETGLLTAATEGPLGDNWSGWPILSHDGRRILQREKDAVVVWDVDAGKALAKHPLPAGPFVPLAANLSPDGSQYARIVADPDSGGITATPARVEILDAKTGQRVRWLEGAVGFNLGLGWQVAFAPDTGLIAALGANGRCIVWNLERGTVVLDRPEGVGADTENGSPRMAFGGVLRFAVTAADRRSVEVHSWGGPVPARFGPFRSVVSWLRFDGSGRWLAISVGKDVHIIDTTGRVPPQLVRSAEDISRTAMFSPDATRLLAFGESGVDGAIYEWDIARLAGHRVPNLGSPVLGELSPVGNRALVGWIRDESGPGIKLGVAELSDGGFTTLTRKGDDPTETLPVWSPDGERVAVVMGDQGKGRRETVVVFDATSGKRLHTFKPDGPETQTVHFSPCGRFVGAVGRDWVRVWEVGTNRVAYRSDPDARGPGLRAAFLPHPTRLGVVRAGTDRAGLFLDVCDLGTGEIHSSGEIAGRFGDEPLTVDPSGRWAVFTYQEAAENIERGIICDTSRSPPIVAGLLPPVDNGSLVFGRYAFGPGWLAVSDDRQVQLYSLPSCEVGPLLVGDDRATAVRFTADGRRALVRYAVGETQHVKVWDTATGQELLTVPAGAQYPLPLGYPAPRFGAERFTVSRRGPNDALEFERLDGTPVPDATARARLGIK